MRHLPPTSRKQPQASESAKFFQRIDASESLASWWTGPMFLGSRMGPLPLLAVGASSVISRQ